MLGGVLFEESDLDALCLASRTQDAGVDQQTGRRLAAEAFLIVGLICLIQDEAEFAQTVSNEIPAIQDSIEVPLLCEMLRILVVDVKGQPGAPALDVIDAWVEHAIRLVDGCGD